MKDRVKRIYHALYGLNFLIIAIISIAICRTTYKICGDYNARDFLEKARYLPHIAWKVPTYSIGLYLLIGLSDYLKTKELPSRKRSILLLYLGDLFILGLITYMQNFSYKGFYLFVCAGLFLHIKEMPGRIAVLIPTLGSYILYDHDLLTVRINMLSFQEYINYYEPDAQFYVYMVKSFLESLNLVLIILFFYSFIHSKVRENKEFIQLNRRLKENLKELKIANRKLEEAGRMKERNRLAHEIHDILGHSLTCISTGLEACIEVAGGQGALNCRLSKIKKVSDKGLQDIRRSVKELKSDVIAEDSLIVSLREMADSINALGRQKLTLAVRGEVPPLQHDEELTVYRLIQESATNSIRHGRAEKITVEMTFGEPGLSVTISDDGRGAASIEKNFGLSHIEEQLALLGGTVTFQSDREKGFRTEAFIPLRQETAT